MTWDDLVAQVLGLPSQPRPDVRSALMVQTFATAIVLSDISAERSAQDAKWGEQNHPDGTGGEQRRVRAELAKLKTDVAAQEGHVTWRDILEEEVAEALAESDLDALRTELVQVAAVAASWVEAIDRREAV